MNTTELIEIARECGAHITYIQGSGKQTAEFFMDELQQFAQRIEQPHLQRIAELEKDCEILQTNLDAALMQVKQLREALEDALRYKRADEKLVDIINGMGQQQQKPKHGRQA